MTDLVLPPPPAESDACDGCDLGVTRRAFLAGATAVGGGLWLFGANAVLDGLGAGAAPAPGTAPPGRVVVVFLRGGMDGLSAVAPVADGTYHSLRPTIAVPEASAIELDDTFGLHPALVPLDPLYRSGRLAFVHAAGNPAASRSHFTAQSLMEQGDDSNSSDGLGWLARYLATRPGPADAAVRAAGLSNNLAQSLRGSEALVVPDLGAYGLLGYAAFARPSLDAFHLGSSPIARRAQLALGSIDVLASLEGQPVPGGVEPAASTLGDAVALLSAGLGVEVLTVDIGGWDTHENMGTVDSGEMRTLLAGLAANLSGFQQALDTAGHSDVTTVVMSEFGRRVAQNGSGGLDHGLGNLMVVMGAGVDGGQVLGDWPGLATLDQGDLRITTDFRDVLWELVRDRLGHPDPGAVFPGHSHTPVGTTA